MAVIFICGGGPAMDEPEAKSRPPTIPGKLTRALEINNFLCSLR